MRVHILKSEEVSTERYHALMHLLNSAVGPVKYIPSEHIPSFEEDDFETWYDLESRGQGKVKFPDIQLEQSVSYSKADFSLDSKRLYAKPERLDVYSWSTLFSKCEQYRKDADIGDDEFVVLVTDKGNEHNWFTGPDLSGKRNFFVQSSGWGFFIDGESKYPVAYHIASGVLRYSMVNNLNEMGQMMHQKPRGCMNDFCQEKTEVTLKLRTGDICPDCLKLMTERKVNPANMSQTFQLMESIRTQILYRERFEVTKEVSRLEIVGSKQKMFFIDFANVELKLTPLEKTVYFFFLKHPEGVAFTSVQDHYQEIRDIYERLAPTKTKEEIEQSARSLCDPFGASLSEKISKIRSKVIQLVGHKMAEYYVISGENSSPRKIGLDRSLVAGELY